MANQFVNPCVTGLFRKRAIVNGIECLYFCIERDPSGFLCIFSVRIKGD